MFIGSNMISGENIKSQANSVGWLSFALKTW